MGRPRLFTDEQMIAWMKEGVAKFGAGMTAAEFNTMDIPARAFHYNSRFGSWKKGRAMGITADTPAPAPKPVAAPKLTLVSTDDAPVKHVAPKKASSAETDAAAKKVANAVAKRNGDVEGAWAARMASTQPMKWCETQAWIAALARTTSRVRRAA